MDDNLWCKLKCQETESYTPAPAGYSVAIFSVLIFENGNILIVEKMAFLSANQSFSIISESDNAKYQLNITCDVLDDVTNLTDQEINDMILYSTSQKLLVKVVIPTIFTIGVLGNLAFFLLLVRVKTMRTTTNFYLVNLAAADLMVLFLETLHRSWKFTDSIISWSDPFRTRFGCGAHFFAINVASSSSIFLITLVTFDRYFAICHPIKYRTMKAKKQIKFILTIFVWIVSVILGFLSVPGFGQLGRVCFIWPPEEKYKNFPIEARLCWPIHPGIEVMSHVVRTVPFIAALIINTIINIRIGQKLMHPPPGENGNRQNQQMKRRIAWMLMANNVIFFCCLAPSHFLILQLVPFLRFLKLSEALEGTLFPVGFVLFMVNSAVNPILYGVVSPSYRRGFLKAFGLAKNQVEPTEGTTETNWTGLKQKSSWTNNWSKLNWTKHAHSEFVACCLTLLYIFF